MFNNEFINHRTEDYQIGLTTVNRRGVETSDEQQNIEGSHGIKMSPTYSRGRRIEIEGIIIADSRENTSKAMDWLDELFALQTVITDTPELKPFVIVDEQDREWKIECKIKEPVEYMIADDDYMDGTTRTFRVVLQSPDARFFSLVEQLVEGIEGHFGGWKLGTKLGKPMNEKFNAIICNGQGNVGSPCKIIIKCERQGNPPIKIRWKGGVFGINVDCEIGDIIEIDSQKKTITKNGINISALRIMGSTRPTIHGITTFTVFDSDSGLYDSDFSVRVLFSNVLM